MNLRPPGYEHPDTRPRRLKPSPLTHTVPSQRAHPCLDVSPVPECPGYTFGYTPIDHCRGGQSLAECRRLPKPLGRHRFGERSFRIGQGHQLKDALIAKAHSDLESIRPQHLDAEVRRLPGASGRRPLQGSRQNPRLAPCQWCGCGPACGPSSTSRSASLWAQGRRRRLR